MSPDIETAAKKVWDYMRLRQPLSKCEAIFLLGNRDDRTAQYAADLYQQGYGDWMIISGGRHRLQLSDGKSEAGHFADIMLQQGVPSDRLILEESAANTGENIKFTYDLLQKRGHQFASLLLVQKPYMERRTYATFKKQWPDPQPDFLITSPPLSFDEIL